MSGDIFGYHNWGREELPLDSRWVEVRDAAAPSTKPGQPPTTKSCPTQNVNSISNLSQR